MKPHFARRITLSLSTVLAALCLASCESLDQASSALNNTLDGFSARAEAANAKIDETRSRIDRAEDSLEEAQESLEEAERTVEEMAELPD